jgi:hypothetical protein
MFDAQLTVQAIYFVDPGLKLKSETDLLAESLVCGTKFLRENSLLVGEINIFLPQSFDFPINFVIFMLIEFLILLNNFLPFGNLVAQLGNFDGVVAMHFANNCLHASLGAILKDNRVYSPDYFSDLHIAVGQLTDQLVEAHPEDKQSSVQPRDIFRLEPLSHQRILIHTQLLQGAVRNIPVEVFIVAVLDQYCIQPLLNAPLLDSSPTPFFLVFGQFPPLHTFCAGKLLLG